MCQSISVDERCVNVRLNKSLKQQGDMTLVLCMFLSISHR